MTLFFTIVGLILFIVLIAYPILLMPHMVGRPDYSPFDNYLFAHRGLHNNQGQAPENSLKAFLLAVEKGYGIELDVQLSKDGIPMVFHDYTLNRVCGREGKVSEFTCKELQSFTLCNSKETIPTLKQVLEVVAKKVPLMVELKIERSDLSLCQAAMKVLIDYKGVYCVQSFNPLVLRWFKKNHEKIVRGQLSTNFIKNKEKGNLFMHFVLGNLLLNFLGKPDYIAYQYKYPHTSSLAIVRGLYNLPTAAWTIQNQKDFEESRNYFNYIIFDSFIPKE